MKKLLYFLIFLIVIPFTLVECDLSNLPSCFLEYIVEIINLPFYPLLSLIKKLLSENVNIVIFQNLWLLIVYIISIFYGILLLYCGFNFIISGYDYSKRENAKGWFRNVLLMIFFVQASYFLYNLTLEISSRLTLGVFDMINSSFFTLTVDNFSNVILELTFGFLYLLVLLITVVLLSVRYLLVAIGLIFFPIGIFFYFIPFLRNYGKLIINSLMVIIFLPFFQSLILLISSEFVGSTFFIDYKILVMIVSFLLIDFLMLFLVFFAIVKSAFSLLNSDVGRGVREVVKIL